MESQDDPEARIRDLERPLTERARLSELGIRPPGTDVHPPPTRPYAANPYAANPYPTQPYPADPYPPPPAMTGPLPPMPAPAGFETPYPGPVHHTGSGFRGAWIVGVAAIAVLGALAAGAVVWFSNTFDDVSSFVNSMTDSPTAAPSVDIKIPPVVVPDIPDLTVPGAAPDAPVTPGVAVNISGVGGHRTLVCAGGDVNVSGVDNVLELTGHCGQVTVSGVRNDVRVESSDVIGVSGFENTITYRAGEPQISQSGSDNSVQRG